MDCCAHVDRRCDSSVGSLLSGTLVHIHIHMDELIYCMSDFYQRCMMNLSLS